MSEESPFPDCNLFHDKFVHCLQPTVQVSHIYKHGSAENCGEFVADWKKCMYAKVTQEPAKILESYKETNYYRRLNEPGNDVFQYKTTPSWKLE